MEIKEEKNRFVLYDGDKEIGEMTWSDADGKIMIIDHTYVDSSYRGQKLASQLVLKGVEKARTDNMKIIPLCPFAKKEFDTIPDYHDVLMTN